jgi:ABC-type thiamine transport system ATPase subunit
MSNLDVDENVTLSERHHTKRLPADIAKEAENLARMAGLDGLPQGRPAVVDHEDLRRSQWVRAGLGSRWLIVLERPGHDLSHGWQSQLNTMVQEWRKEGAVVVWMCESTAEWNDKNLNPSLKLRAEENKLLVES